MKKILLASASPRRAELLGQVGLPFRIIEIDSDGLETGLQDIGLPPEEIAARAAARKLRAAMEVAPGAAGVFLCADTVVTVDGEIFGKPADAGDAARMLRELSGRTHRVITACAMAEHGGPAAEFVETTEVKFHDLDESDINNYVSTGEPFDKAGAYGIQGRAAAFVSSVCGCYPNVVGLPVARVARELDRTFSLPVGMYWKK